MKIVKLYVNLYGSYSGANHYEEVYLPEGLWGTFDIPNDFTIYELDGKHSATTGPIESQYVDQDSIRITESDGDGLFEEIYELVPDYFNLQSFQDYVRTLVKVKELNVTIRLEDEEKVMKLLKDYIV